MLVGAVGMMVILVLGGRLGQLRTVRLSRSVVLGGVFLGLSLATYLSATVLTGSSSPTERSGLSSPRRGRCRGR